jgi:hypothetical protein
MALVCIPFFLLILILTRPVMEAGRKLVTATAAAFNFIAQRLAPILPHTSETGKHHPRRHQRGGAGAGAARPGVRRTQSVPHQNSQQAESTGKRFWQTLKATNLRWRPWAKTIVVEGTAENGKETDAIV